MTSPNPRLRPARILAALALAGLALAAGPVAPASAADRPAYASRSQVLPLGIGKSVVIDLPRETSDVLVANPAIANAVVRSSRRAYLIGVAPGQTSIIFFDPDGRQIAAYDVEVGRDATGMKAALAKIVPNAAISVDMVNDSVVLSGQVASAADAQTVAEAAARLVGGPDKVVNALTIRDKEQVLLKVTVAEVNRNVIKQLGVNWNGNYSIGDIAIGLGVNPGFPINPTNLTEVFTGIPGETLNNVNQNLNGNGVGTVVSGTHGAGYGNIRALEQTGVFRTLAEPTLTAISGESADFLAGGEFPYVTGYACNGNNTTACTPTIDFKDFGVSLKFTPVVLSSGRISLRVSTEVSEIDPTISTSTSAPALSTRRATSTVELPSGGSMAMAGMLQQKSRQAIQGLPGLLSLPVLGTLFKSRDYQRGETELVILVTPYLAKPAPNRALARPDDGFADPSDPSTVLLSRLNRIYGVPGTAADPKLFEGRYGFIID